MVVRCWALAYGLMVEQDWPNEIPAEFMDLYGLRALRDSGRPGISGEARERARRFAEESVDGVRREIFPLHGLQEGSSGRR